jgi:hypothetical protein
MYLGEPTNQGRRRIIGGIVAGLSLLFLIAFWHELVDVFMMITQFPDGFFPERIESLKILGFNGLTFLLLGGMWTLLISQQALLPASTPQERWRTAYQFLLFIFRRHGPAVFIKDGKVLSTKEDARDGPGVAVVDFNSAVVLEERLPPPGLGSGFDSILHQLAWSLGLADKAESPRVKGPGIVFTRSRERTHAAVDLRRQFHILKDVSAHTRNGIEVKANVWSIFSIGQNPDVLQVTYIDEKRPENLRVLSLEDLGDGHYRVSGISDELDDADREEIHHYFHLVNRTYHMLPFSSKFELEIPTGTNPDDIEPIEQSTNPVFWPHRVFSAVFSQARGDNDNWVPWTDLPTRQGAIIFRELISQVNYDDLYQGGNSIRLPLLGYRAMLRQKMRNSGRLAFRLLMRTNGEPFQLRRVLDESEMEVSKVRHLTNSKVLRDRGIKVIASGFGDVLPLSEAIYVARLKSWQAPWQRDQVMISGQRELQAMRVRSRARALAQQEMISSLNTIIETTSSPGVMTVRLMQALELVASDPRTRELLPPDTIDMMQKAQNLLTGNNPEKGPL